MLLSQVHNPCSCYRALCHGPCSVYPHQGKVHLQLYIKVTHIKVKYMYNIAHLGIPDQGNPCQCYTHQGVHPIRRRWGKSQFFEVMAVCQVRHLWSCNKDKDFTRADFDILPLHHHFPLLFVADFISWVEKNHENELTSHNIWLKIYVHLIHILSRFFFFKFSSDSFLSMFNSRFLICSTLDDDRSL